MKYDIILCGVGGQGVLSVAAAIATAAGLDGLKVRQSEVHGMAQRGGAVLSHLRISDSDIPGDLVPRGAADMILSMEPLECLRYLEYLKPDGKLVAAEDPFVNIPNYPDVESLKKTITGIKGSKLVAAAALAKEAGNARATNMVMVGAAGVNMPLKKESMEKAISLLFEKKGEEVVQKNLKALSLGGNA